jgi:hypothetical protein
MPKTAKAQTIDCVGCGAELEVPGDRSTWDVTTKRIRGKETVVERHVSITCEHCGTTGHPFLPYGNDDTAQAGRDRLTPHFEHLTDENGVIGEVANIVREPVDPPQPLGGESD